MTFFHNNKEHARYSFAVCLCITLTLLLWDHTVLYYNSVSLLKILVEYKCNFSNQNLVLFPLFSSRTGSNRTSLHTIHADVFILAQE